MRRFLSLSLGATLLLAAPSGAAEKEGPKVLPGELAGFRSRLEGVQEEYQKWEKEIAKELEDAAAVKIAMVKKQARPRQLSYLRFLTMLEGDLRLLGAPEDQVDDDLEVPEFGVQERRRVEVLRQKIRDGERKRIRAELKEGRGMHSDEKIEKSLNRDELALDSLFNRKAAKLKRDIAKAERDLERVKRSSGENERRILALEAEMEKWRSQAETLHRFTFGFAPGVGFGTKADSADTSASGKFLARLVTERERVLRVLRGETELGGEGKKKGGLVGGSFVYSSNLGVVLDVSGSMTSHIEPLKKEIAKTFAVPRYREIPGCRLTGTSYGGLTLAALTENNPKAATMTVMEDLIMVYGVDTVYWFCDLRDGFDYAGLRRLRFLFKRGGSAFHVKSMAMRPDRELKPLIDDFQK